MLRWGWIAAVPCALLLATCAKPPPERVTIAGHDAFFVWAGVHPPDSVKQAKTVYLLAGEVRAQDNSRFVSLRPGTPHVPPEIFMTVRAERLDWQESVYRDIFDDLTRWNASGHVAGLQIDFDSHTHGLGNYAHFLADLRRRLPTRYRLSVTGLMDWSAQGDPAALAKLAGVADEVVIQTYQGRRTIPGYERYMDSLRRLPMPFRIGLVEGGEWREPGGLTTNPHFLGYVVFLLPG